MTAAPVLRFPARPGGEPPPVLLCGGQVTAPAGGEPLTVVTDPAEVRHCLVHAPTAGTIPGTGELRGHPLTGAEAQSPDGGLLNMNPPALTAYRQRISGLFSEQAVAKHRHLAESAAEQAVAGLRRQGPGPVDIVAAFAEPFTADMVMTTLGLPLTDWATEILPASAAAFGLVQSPEDIPGIEAAWERLYAYYAARLPHLTGLAGAVRDALAGFTPAQVVHVLATVSNGFPAFLPVLVMVLVDMLQHPTWVRDCLAGRRSWRDTVVTIIGTTALFPVALPRYAVPGSTVRGCPVKPGTLLLPSLVAAGRGGAPPAIALGAGPHFCPGAAYTWQWATVAAAAFFGAFPGAQLAGPLDWQPGTLSTPRTVLTSLRQVPNP